MSRQTRNETSTRRRPARVAARIALAVCLAASAAAGQDLTVKAPPQEHAIALINGTIHPVSGPVIEHGYVLFDHGVIKDVGAGDGTFDAGTMQIECAGKHVYPGLIGAYTQLGLTEIGSVRATHDYNEVGPITPEVRAAVAVNPDSTLIPVTRSNGVLVAGVFPTGGAIPGQMSVMQLDGWTYEDMTVSARAGLVVDWPRARVVDGRASGPGEQEQRRQIEQAEAQIRDTFDSAAAYVRARAADPTVPEDLRYEQMRPYLPDPAGGGDAGPEKPVFILADEYDQIVDAVSFIADEGLKGVIVGGRDAALTTDLLKRQNVAVILRGPFRFPGRADSPYDEMFTLASKLEAAGVTWCMASGEEASNERNLPYASAMAVAHGLDHDAGLRSITLYTARILGVADRLGSIEPGKDATLIVTTGDPLDVATHVTHAFIRGRRIDLSNRQTKLADKYRQKYRQKDEQRKDGAQNP